MSGLLSAVGFRIRKHVGISISASGFIELVYVDKKSKKVLAYAAGNIKYNSAIREIIDYDEFAEVVQDLFNEAGLDPRECTVTLNIPNVHFGIEDIEDSASEQYLIEDIQTNLEDLYIFKRNEPVISKCVMERVMGRSNRSVIYGAVQQKASDEIVRRFDTIIEAELVRIDTSYSSMLKAIQFCDRFEQYVRKGQRTQIILVSSNSCCSFYLEGNILVSLKEEILAVKSYSSDEVYSAISKIATESINNNKPTKLLIISETDEVNSELVARGIPFDGGVDYLNKNLNASDQFIDISPNSSSIDENMISYLTIEAVGAAVSDYDDYPLNINFIQGDKALPKMVEVGEYEIEILRFAVFVVFVAILAGALVGFLSGFVMTQIKNSQKDTIKSLETQKNDIFKRKEKAEGNQTENIFPVLTRIVDNNKNVIEVYAALGECTPESIYINKFVANEKGGIGIQGEAKTSESVQEFIKGLKVKNDDLMVTK
ncbi:MAG: hypothetical protein LUG16_08985, partial [Candidatus Gastranaerophilales bacterium]|nr:hypothetical protein [Candidatus Gastranaerophilales bacterium]